MQVELTPFVFAYNICSFQLHSLFLHNVSCKLFQWLLISNNAPVDCNELLTCRTWGAVSKVLWHQQQMLPPITHVANDYHDCSSFMNTVRDHGTCRWVLQSIILFCAYYFTNMLNYVIIEFICLRFPIRLEGERREVAPHAATGHFSKYMPTFAFHTSKFKNDILHQEFL